MDIVAQFLMNLQSRDPKSDALILIKENGTKEYYTWADYLEMAIYAAKGLEEEGVKSGDRVAIIALSLPESFFAILGTMLIGAIPVPINAPLAKESEREDLKKILSHCQPKLILANSFLEPHLSDIEHFGIEEIMGAAADHYFSLEPNGERSIFVMDPDKIKSETSGNIANGLNLSDTRTDKPILLMPYGWKYQPKHTDDLLIMPYTSGTTNDPKGVMLSHGNISDRVEAIGQELEVSNRERVLSYLSLGHISDLIATFFCHIRFGFQVYFTEHAKEVVGNREKMRRKFPSVLKKTKPTVFLAVPKVWMNMRNQIQAKIGRIPLTKRLKSWLVKKSSGFEETRHFISAGSKILPLEKSFFAGLNIEIRDIYGQTETAGPVTIDGKVIGSTWVGIDFKTSEMSVAGPNVMLGYYNNQEATDKAFEPFGTSRAYRTGDIVRRINDKVFYICKMGKAVKLAQGEFVWESQIEHLEETIKSANPEIDEAIVYGDSQPHLSALIFVDVSKHHETFPQLFEKIAYTVGKAGRGIRKIQMFALIDSGKLEQTPTLKTKREKMIEKFQNAPCHFAK